MEALVLYWLVLVTVVPSNVAMMHVGNFESYAACDKAAHEMQKPVEPSPQGRPDITLLCIQANGSGVPPPKRDEESAH
jgi:hypothetical protein